MQNNFAGKVKDRWGYMEVGLKVGGEDSTVSNTISELYQWFI